MSKFLEPKSGQFLYVQKKKIHVPFLFVTEMD